MEIWYEGEVWNKNLFDFINRAIVRLKDTENEFLI